MNLYPAILTDDIKVVQEQLDMVKQVEEVETVHLDVIDGQFANNMTVTPLDLVGLDFGELELGFHFMVHEPMSYVHELINCAQDLPIKTVIGQVEQMSHQDEFVSEIKKQGWQAGLCLNLHTPLEAVDDKVWSELDALILLAVQAGFQGQEFSAQIYDKIGSFQELQQKQGLSQIELIIDGGVKLDKVGQLKQAQVDSIAVGSGIWKAKDVRGQLLKFLDELG